MGIRVLPQHLINQIAAGEVVERPSSVIKELMENALDAKATSIEVKIVDAGKSLISVSDDGCGMDAETIKLCILSHATSKLESDDLLDINTFGFRGEALPSITSISRVNIVSSQNGEVAWQLHVEGNSDPVLSPASRRQGTTVEVRDLFFATPARLKFLKSDATESDSCYSIFNRVALANPHVEFKLVENGREKFRYKRCESFGERIDEVLGEDFSRNTLPVDVRCGAFHLHGVIGVPTFNKATSSQQIFFVNGRFVRDKLLSVALKAAYANLVPKGRHAVAVLHLDLPNYEVDVNAHPAKIEVRFRHSDQVRHFIIRELKDALTSSVASCAVVGEAFSAPIQNMNSYSPNDFTYKTVKSKLNSFPVKSRSESNIIPLPKSPITTYRNIDETDALPVSNPNFVSEQSKFFQTTEDSEKLNMGQALYQIDKAYIVSVTDDSLIIVDQHAAAERITLEQLKTKQPLESQMLLIPEPYHLTAMQMELIKKHEEFLMSLGIKFEQLSADTICIYSIPAILDKCEVHEIIGDILNELEQWGESYTLDQKIHGVLSTMACHGSLRAGKQLSMQEMNSLLRTMENTINIAQCCHGRPAYVRLYRRDLNKIFERC